MNSLKYPLEQLMTIKKNRYDQALKILEEKKAILATEEKKLKEIEDARDKVLHHKQDKLAQLRQSLDEGTTTDKIQQMKNYLKVVDERLSEKEKQVEEQKKKTAIAKNQVQIAKENVMHKQKDVEKMEIHKKEWEKEVRHWVSKQEEKEHDELGTSGDIRRKKERKQKDINK